MNKKQVEKQNNYGDEVDGYYENEIYQANA